MGHKTCSTTEYVCASTKDPYTPPRADRTKSKPKQLKLKTRNTTIWATSYSCSMLPSN